MKKSLYKIGAAVFVAVFVAASFGFSTQAAKKKMTNDEPIEITIKLDRATGSVLEVLPKNPSKHTTVTKEEWERIYNSELGFRYIYLLLHARSSPGCYYYYDPTIGWVKDCW